MQKIAIAISDAELFLVATVVRATATDVYVNWPRDYIPEWKPHTSYHASGQVHHKSFGRKFGIQQKPKPTVGFTGTVSVVSFGIAVGEHTALNLRCDPQIFNAVFKIPVALLRPEQYKTCIYVDLVEPGVEPILFPGAVVLQQTVYQDAEPWIVLTFLELP